jgi:rhodanese-related sulfurtransferase
MVNAPAGAPLVPPLFVAEHGLGVRIADIRPRHEATGALGYIPGCVFLDIGALERLSEDDDASPLVLVCGDGAAAAKAALRLEAAGTRHVAAMSGGVAAWRARDLYTSRDPAGVHGTPFREPDADADAGPITLERVRDHVGDPRSVRWIRLLSLINHSRLSCIDGRDERAIVGSPGGDGGEFLLLLGALEALTGQRLDDETVARGLLAHLDAFGRFYMHTDMHALDALSGALRADPRLEPAVAGLTQPEEWSGFLRRPAPELRPLLLDYLVDPAHIGCGHIRLMLQHSDEYGVRKEIVLAFLRAFFRLTWEGAPELGLSVLPGDHDEAAILSVSLEEQVWALSRVPLIAPSCHGRQMFVNHPDVSSYLRRATVRSFVRHAGHSSVEPGMEPSLLEAAEELAKRQLGVTAGHLAKGLPIFDAVFAGDGSFEVRKRPVA